MTNKKSIIYIVCICIAAICQTISIPTVLWAQVSTTNLVDRKTGDFNYNVDLLEIPGPNGNASINMSYQSGARLDDEASWVGLGWTLNPGSIDRSIVGIPDDYAGSKITITDTWQADKGYYSISVPLYYPAYLHYGDKPWNYNSYTFWYTIAAGTDVTGTNYYGMLNAYLATQGSNITKNRSMDFQLLTDSLVQGYQYYSTFNGDPASMLGGILPNYDQYKISGPGLDEEIEPVVLDNGSIFGSKDSVAGVSYTILKAYVKPKQQFRFKNEYSNSFTVSPTNMTAADGTNPIGYNLGSNNLGYTYKGPIEGGYDNSTMKLGGKRHVNYFTNSEISSGTAKIAGFIDYPEAVIRTTRSYTTTEASPKNFTSDVSALVGGYAVTDENGNTYHYALPVYQYGSQGVMSAPSNSVGKTKRVTIDDQAFAYSWLLTTVTGPDFVDKNNNGIADEEDAGYWVNYIYGMLTSSYITRVPYTGTIKAIDNSLSYSGFYKELYYLDAVYTKSHTALFLKSGSRGDAMGAADIANGGYSSTYSQRVSRLVSINLYKNEDIISMSSVSSNTFTKSIYNSIKEIRHLSNQFATNSYANDNNVIDVNDIYVAAFSNTHFTTHNLLKRIQISTWTQCSQLPNATDPYTGKPVVNSIRYYGRNETREKPSIDFVYDLVNPKTASNVTVLNIPSDYGTTSREGKIILSNSQPFVEGDLITFGWGYDEEEDFYTYTYYATLIRQTVYSGTQTQFDVHFLGNQMPGSFVKGSSVIINQTKNPPYTADHSDNWGFFKSDYFYTSPDASYPNIPANLQNFDKRCNRISSQSADVWSLRRITTSSGSTIDIDYESDTHGWSQTATAARDFKSTLNIKQFKYTKANGTTSSNTKSFLFSGINRTGIFEFFFNEWIDCTEEFYVGQIIEISTVGTLKQVGGSVVDIGYPISTIGYGDFQITYVGLNAEGISCIKGNFMGANGFMTGYSVPSSHDVSFFNNGSYVKYEPHQKFGGGTRVKKITIKETFTGETFETNFDYNKPSGYSSGVTASEPLSLANSLSPLDESVSDYVSYYDDVMVSTSPYYMCYQCGNDLNYCKMTYPTRSTLLTYGKAMTSNYVLAQVVYEYVTEKKYNNGIQNSSYDRYHFSVFKDDMIMKAQLFSSTSDDLYNTYSAGVRTFKISDYTSIVGQILEHKVYDISGNILNETVYNYTSGANHQGVIEQVFHQIRGGLGVVTIKSYVPYVLQTITKKDHIKGISQTISYADPDFYTGIPLKVASKDSYGNDISQVSQPAYPWYTSLPSTGSELGLKVKNINNKHLLTAIAANYTYIPNNTGSLSFTLSTLTSTTGASTTRYKATLDNNKKLPFSSTMNMQQNGMLNIGGTLTASTITISYIYPDRNSFEFYHDNASLGSNGSVTYLNINTPLSATIQPWSNNWQYRNYNTSTNLYENLSVTESSPSTPNAYKRTWGPAAPYVWSSPFLNTDGSYKSTGTGSYVEFDWYAQLIGNPQSNTASAYWQKGTQPTLKDEFSNTLEVKDINGNYSATKMAIDQSYIIKNTGGYTFTYPNTANYNNYVLSSGKNTNYASFAYSGFEEISKPTGASTDQYGGEIQTTNVLSSQTAASSGIKPHSGNYSFKLASGNNTTPFTAYYRTANTEGNIIRGKKYRASVWMHKSNNANAQLYVSVIGNSLSYIWTGSTLKSASNIVVGDWTLVTVDFDVPDTYTSAPSTTDAVSVKLYANGGDGYFDDFAIRPIDADQTSYVYDPLTKQVLYVIDKDGFYTRYQYDNTGRLIATYKETLAGEKKIATQEYNFAKP